LKLSLQANGIDAALIIVQANSPDRLLVKNWTYGNASNLDDPKYQWKLILNNADGVGGMVPPPTSYGDMINGDGMRGQNNTNPSEKAFTSHVIVRIDDSNVNLPYLDPSYGMTYKNEAEFESKALDGYYKQDPDSSSGPENFVVRKSLNANNIREW
jgi:hypothetical protein